MVGGIVHLSAQANQNLGGNVLKAILKTSKICFECRATAVPSRNDSLCI